MAYDDVKQEMGRRPVSFAEVGCRKCLNTYGVAPCTAAIGVTGLNKCFNTLWTCQDIANYNDTVTRINDANITNWNALSATVTDEGDGEYEITIAPSTFAQIYVDPTVSAVTHNASMEARLVSGSVAAANLELNELAPLETWIDVPFHAMNGSWRSFQNNGTPDDTDGRLRFAVTSGAGGVVFRVRKVQLTATAHRVPFIEGAGSNVPGLNLLLFRFSSERIDNIQAASDLPTFPVLRNFTTAPTRLDPGRSLGIRGSVKVSLQDFPWGDVGTDPYVGDRSYDPEDQGSFFGKFIARLQYFENLTLKLYTGYLDENGDYQSENFIKREYLTFRFAGPSVDGQVVIEGKDPLKATDNLRSQVPLPSEGYIDADINDSATVLQLAAGQAADYSTADPWVRIDDEVMEITNVNVGLDQLTVTRATLPSFYPGPMAASSHDRFATVQQCELFEDLRVDDLVYELLTAWANIDSTLIDSDDWDIIATAWFSSYIFSALITEPTGVGELLNEICKHNVLIWWDERAQKIMFDALKPYSDLGTIFVDDDSNVIRDSVSTSKDPRARISRSWVYYGQRNPVDTDQRLNRYASVQAVVDLDAEDEDQYGTVQLFEVRSRWLTAEKQAVALDIAGRTLAEYRDTKSVIKIAMDPKDDDVWTGAQIQLQSRYFQDEFGASPYKPFLILQAVEKVQRGGKTIIEYTMQSIRARGRCAVIGPDSLVDYTSATDEEKRLYGWICSTATERMSNGDPPYVIC